MTSKFSSKAVTFSLLIFLTSCEAIEGTSRPNVFDSPKSYVGQRATACGFLSGAANISPTRSSMRGLNVHAGRFATQLLAIGKQQKICLAGRVTYEGCDTDPNTICTDFAHDYSIRVEGIY